MCFLNNTGNAIRFENSGVPFSNSVIRYCTIKGGTGISCGTNAIQNVKFYNCTFDGPVALTGSGNEVKNTFYLNTLSGATTASNNINIASINTSNYFQNYGAGNFRLKSTATLAIDHGTNVGLTKDYDGNPVPYNSIPDIGAFEFQGAGSSLLTGLEEYYNFNETSGQLLDVEPTTPINSTIVSATQGVTGKIGTCYSFNGTANKITFPDHSNWTVNTTTNFSISAWINFTGNNVGQWGNIFGTASTYSFQVKKISSNNYQLVWWAGGSVATSNTFTITTGTWYNVVMTKSGSSEVRFYKDNLLIGTVTPSDVNGNPSTNFIGGNESTEYFNGKIDELGIWKKVLTATEISNLYNNGNGSTYPWSSTLKSAQITSDTTDLKKIEYIDTNNDQIYPNPASGLLYIKDLSGLHNTSVEVYDLKGKIFIQKVIPENSLDVSPLNKGIYFIKLKNAKGIRVYKFIKD